MNTPTEPEPAPAQTAVATGITTCDKCGTMLLPMKPEYVEEIRAMFPDLRAPAQTAREWVRAWYNYQTTVELYATLLAMADRADRAEAEAKKWREAYESARKAGNLAVDTAFETATKAEAERDRLREALALEETNAAHWRGKYEALNQTTNKK